MYWIQWSHQMQCLEFFQKPSTKAWEAQWYGSIRGMIDYTKIESSQKIVIDFVKKEKKRGRDQG